MRSIVAYIRGQEMSVSGLAASLFAECSIFCHRIAIIVAIIYEK